MATNNNQNNNGNQGQKNESEPTPLSRRDYGNIGIETYDSVYDVKNSMPPPPNPNNRGGGQKDNE